MFWLYKEIFKIDSSLTKEGGKVMKKQSKSYLFIVLFIYNKYYLCFILFKNPPFRQTLT